MNLLLDAKERQTNPFDRWRQSLNLLLPIWMIGLAISHALGGVLAATFSDDPGYYAMDQISFAFLEAIFVTCFFLCFGSMRQARLQHDAFDYIFVFFYVVVANALFLYFASGLDPSFIDALLKSTATFSTTKADPVVGRDNLPFGFHFNTACLQLMGAAWFVQFTLVAVPSHILRGVAQSDGLDLNGQLRFTAKLNVLWIQIWGVIFVLMLLGAAGFVTLGLSTVDAIVYASGLVSLGGHLSSDAELSWLEPRAQVWSIVLMMLGGTNWLLHIRAVCKGNMLVYRRNWELRGFVALVLIASALAYFLPWIRGYRAPGGVLDAVLFTVSTVTTTGAGSADYLAWPGIVGFVLMLSIVGACAGSPSGGVKVSRLILQGKVFSLIFQGRRHSRIGGNPISLSSMQFMQIYMTIFLFLILVSTMLLSLIGLDFTTAFSLAVTNLSNLGVGIGDRIGPVGAYTALPDAAKICAIALMIAGRMELGLVFLFVSRRYWQSSQAFRGDI